MRVLQNVFDYGDTGIVALSTSMQTYGPVPAIAFGKALLWKHGASTDLFDLCTRPVKLDAQQDAIATLRSRFVGAAASVHKQIDWAATQLAEDYRELPAHARQMGGSLLLIGFVAAIQPRCWRLIDVSQGRMVWESDADMAEQVLRRTTTKSPLPAFLSDSQIPVSSGPDFVEIQIGMSRVIFVLEGGHLVLAEWSAKAQKYADNHGVRSGMLSHPDRDENRFVLIDPRTGRALKSFAAPTPSKGISHFATSHGTDRIAVSHTGGTVDIVDDFDGSHFSIRPIPQVGRTEDVSVHLSYGAEWLGADGWHEFRVVNLAKREVAELSVPAPNVQDDPQRVLYDRGVLATGHGVALMDESGLSVIPYADLEWHPATQPRQRTTKKRTLDHEKLFAHWRRPALTLKAAKRGGSWLYGSPDLPVEDVPRHEGRPMQLLARIDLTDAAGLLRENPWPTHGALYFFTAVDSAGAPMEDEMFNPRATRVLWWTGVTVADGAQHDELAPRQPLELATHEAVWPDISAAIVEAANLDDVALESYRAWLETQGWADQPSGHRLGGYPTILQQNDLEAQAAQIADAENIAAHDVAENSAAHRWRLLLQLDSDDTCTWGTDSGMLYFLIRDDDLARHDFSRVVAICEGY
jgi:uncharacterized protein YwqG